MDGKCTELAVRIGPSGVRIEYDAAMPLCVRDGEVEALALLHQLRACHNRKKHIDVGDEFCELGLAVLNACCTRFSAGTVSDAAGYSFAFEEGRLVDQTELGAVAGPRTWFDFELDYALLGGQRLIDIERLRAGAATLMDAVRGLHVRIARR